MLGGYDAVVPSRRRHVVDVVEEDVHGEGGGAVCGDIISVIIFFGEKAYFFDFFLFVLAPYRRSLCWRWWSARSLGSPRSTCCGSPGSRCLPWGSTRSLFLREKSYVKSWQQQWQQQQQKQQQQHQLATIPWSGLCRRQRYLIGGWRCSRGCWWRSRTGCQPIWLKKTQNKYIISLYPFQRFS